MDGLWWKTLVKWMIWEKKPYFRKHPYTGTATIIDIQVWLFYHNFPSRYHYLGWLLYHIKLSTIIYRNCTSRQITIIPKPEFFGHFGGDSHTKPQRFGVTSAEVVIICSGTYNYHIVVPNRYEVFRRNMVIVDIRSWLMCPEFSVHKDEFFGIYASSDNQTNTLNPTRIEWFPYTYQQSKKNRWIPNWRLSNSERVDSHQFHLLYELFRNRQKVVTTIHQFPGVTENHLCFWMILIWHQSGII